MSIIIVAAIGKNNELGKNNNLIWRIPEDMKFFKELTTGKIEPNEQDDNYVIMGRKTFESLPGNLPDRKMIVLSSHDLDKYYDVDSYKDIKTVLERYKDKELYIIGGASIYEQFLPLADTMYLTEINKVDFEADAHFPYFNRRKWDKENILEETTYKDITYTRNKYVRKRVKDER